MARKNITWKSGNSPRDAVLKPKYTEDRSFQSIDEPTREFYNRHLYVGSLWIIKNNIYVQTPSPKTISHPIPYVGRMVSWSDRGIKQGTLAIYAGQTCVEEKDSRGMLICPLRHMFVVEGTQVMTLELDSFFHPADA